MVFEELNFLEIWLYVLFNLSYDKLKERIKDYSIMINNNICPGFGNKLILNKRNKCSNCKYKIKKISNK
jgi:hypothetical protein